LTAIDVQSYIYAKLMAVSASESNIKEL